MNTRNFLEEKILEDFRTLPEELRNKFLTIIKNLKAEALSSNIQNSASQKHIWGQQDEEFFELLQQRHFKIDKTLDIDLLMQDMNNGLP